MFTFTGLDHMSPLKERNKLRFSVLSLLPLLGWTSTALQEIVPDTSHLHNVSVLNSDEENRIPNITVNGSVLAHLYRSNFKKAQTRSSFSLANTNLQWVTWSGSLPYGAVSIYNDYTRRTDYVCSYGCGAGFYSPSLGPYCRHPYGGKEELRSPFEVLINKEQLEYLEWKDGSYGSVPWNSIYGCAGWGTFVGKNQYGLGKVVPKHKAFFLPYNGKEYSYKTYQVLTVNQDVIKEHISNVNYKTDAAKLTELPPETMRKSTVINNDCQIPIIVSAAIEFSAETTQQFSKGTTVEESIEHSVTVQLNIPPNSMCTVNMVGYKYKANVPFTARLQRTYRNGAIRSGSITGTYDKVQVGEVVAVVDRCEPIPCQAVCLKE
ncbi:hypothetical protein Q5P01_015329 [Channa striata]|uniref:Natterin-3-like n=1 Tax=Channa striata TaxID=64152 RepID=A0AA88SIR7_CHASR|nr:hypothetical protein Q5P01_015329 [Channa striata]